MNLLKMIRKFMCESLDIHKWHYETPDHRICVRCGQCEAKRRDIYDDYWHILTFDKWYKEVEEYKEIIKKIKDEGRKSKSRSIEFLKKRGLWKGW